MIDPSQFDRRFRTDRSYNIKQLWSSHEAMLRLTASGLNNKQVAALTGVTPQTVSNVRNSPSGRTRLLEYTHSLDQLMLDTQSSIREFAPVARDVLTGVVDGTIPAPITLRARYAADLLDRAGLSAVRKVMSVQTTLTREEIDAIKSRALEAARANGTVVDVDQS